MKDYYVVLGISRGESPQGIRRAFRDLAREHHPDRAGPGGTPMFREVVEAYRVLSDPEQRIRYDASLREDEPIPVRRARPWVRPARVRPSLEPIDLVGPAGMVRPSADALLDRILRGFVGLPISKAERAEPILCDVALDPEEALRGGLLPIRIPVARPCPACHGTGRVSAYPCRGCDATGQQATEVVVPIQIPPGVRPGTILEMGLQRWGIRNLWLRARIGIRR